MPKSDKHSRMIRIRKSDGNIVYRVPKIIPFGNFQQMVVRVEGADYLVGDGDEYIRGEDPQGTIYTLGRKL